MFCFANKQDLNESYFEHEIVVAHIENEIREERNAGIYFNCWGLSRRRNVSPVVLAVLIEIVNHYQPMNYISQKF